MLKYIRKPIDKILIQVVFILVIYRQRPICTFAWNGMKIHFQQWWFSCTNVHNIMLKFHWVNLTSTKIFFIFCCPWMFTSNHRINMSIKYWETYSSVFIYRITVILWLLPIASIYSSTGVWVELPSCKERSLFIFIS